MVVRGPRYAIRSRNANEIYWEQAVYPDWSAISAFRYLPGQRAGSGVEPHYHDNDEIWLFLTGRGEVWLDGAAAPITPGTVVYTPMGAVHRFQMFTDFDNMAIVTPLERQRRPVHLLVEAAGPPTPTVPGFAVGGAANHGPLPSPGPRCPLSELRSMAATPGQALTSGPAPSHEHWMVLSGAIDLEVDDQRVELHPHDLATVKAGAARSLGAREPAVVALARERSR